MAQQTKATIKNWFKTGLKPTQAQFWDLFDSYYHKAEGIAIGAITGLTEFLAPFNDHVNSEDAHAALFAKTKIYAAGEFQIWKLPGNENLFLEVGDIACGLLEDGITFISFGQYLGDDPQNPDNWNTSPMTFEPLEGEGGGGPGGGGGGDPIM